MANIASAQKRIRTNETKRLRNQMYTSRVKTLLRKAEQSISSGKPDIEVIGEALRTLDKAANKGILHRNNVDRRKSRLMLKFNAVQAK